MPDTLVGTAVFELRSRSELAHQADQRENEVEFSYGPQMPDGPDHPNRSLWPSGKPIGSLSLVLPLSVAAEGIEGKTAVFSCRRRTERPNGTVECLFFPQKPPANDLDHPNRRLWRDLYRDPNGSLNLVLDQETAEAVQIGDVVELDVTEQVGETVEVEIEETS